MFIARPSRTNQNNSEASTTTSDPIHHPRKIMIKAKRSSLEAIGLATLILIVVLGITSVGTLIAVDVIGPYPILTPALHLVLKIITPFVPLVAPIFLGIFIKVCRHESWPGKRGWVFMTGCWILQHLQRVVADVVSVWRDDATTGQKVGVGLVLLVILAEGLDIEWEGGRIEGWVGKIAEQGRRKEAAKMEAQVAKMMEDGQALPPPPPPPDMEKTGLMVQEMRTGAEEEKALLAEREAIAIAIDGTGVEAPDDKP